MFRPYETPQNPPPSRPQNAMDAAPHGRRATDQQAAPKVYAPLPSNWEQMDPDQRLRCVGEW